MRAENTKGSLAVHLVLWTGARYEEVCALRVRDLVLNGEPARWHIPRDATKSDAGVPVVELPPIIATRLEVRVDKLDLQLADLAIRARQRKGETTKARQRGKSWLRDTMRLCSVAGVREVPPHGLHGTLATLLERRGVRVADVAAALGHADAKVTEASYIEQDGRTVVRFRALEARRPRNNDTAGDAAT